MPSPAPTYDADLVLVTQPLRNAAMSRRALLTYACTNSTAGSAQVLANLVYDAFADTMAAQFDNAVTLDPCEIIWGNGTVTPLQAVSNLPVVVGTRANNSPSPNNNLLLKKRTLLAGRRNRGRMYLPWSFDDVSIDEAGIIVAAEVTNSQTRATAWLNRLTTDNTPMVICNRTVDPNPTPPPDTYVSAYETGQLVTQLVVDGLVASQRRRVGR